ncbi:hypothetical protein JDS70_04225 [Bacillus cereus]|nr:hypothetical protein [Bacillus cereus]
MEHPIQGLITIAVQQHLKQMTDVNTIIDDPIKTFDRSCLVKIKVFNFRNYLSFLILLCMFEISIRFYERLC